MIDLLIKLVAASILALVFIQYKQVHDRQYVSIRWPSLRQGYGISTVKP